MKEKIDSTINRNNEILDAALDYGYQGFSVIPIRGKDYARGATEEERMEDSKTPLVSWGEYQKERPTEEVIKNWWTKWPKANIGIVTGTISGIAVVDLDSKEAVKLAQGFPATPKVRTGRGYHLYYTHKDGARNFQKREDLPGIDLRGDGGYVVAPPSVHYNGTRYEWVDRAGLDEIPLAGLPEEVLAKPQEARSLKELYQGAPEGMRNQSLARLAGSWVGLGLPLEECMDLAKIWNRQNSPPLENREVEKTVKSICDTHQRNSSKAFLPYKGEDGEETNTHTGFNPVPAKDLLKVADKPIPWRWERMAPEGRLLLCAGFMKTGKSEFIYGLAVAMAQGASYLGMKTQKCGVLILAVEEHQQDVSRRLKKLGMEEEDPIEVHTGPLPLTEALIRQMKEYIIRHDIGLLIVDTLSRFWKIKDENDNAAISREVSPLLDLARDTNVTIILIHHESKKGGTDGRSIRRLRPACYNRPSISSRP